MLMLVSFDSLAGSFGGKVYFSGKVVVLYTYFFPAMGEVRTRLLHGVMGAAGTF